MRITMSNYTAAWPHGSINEVFKNIYVVRGTNITDYDGMKIQHSRNMTIVKDNDDLTLVNTVRLDENGLKQLDEIGIVKHVIRIGAFHGRDDDFYLDKYGADFWALADTQKSENRKINHVISDDTHLPIRNSQFLISPNTSPAEGVIYLKQDDGILISCDSIKNWIKVDKFFSEETGKMYLEAGEIQKARISAIWLQATGASKADFEQLSTLVFCHLISAHGEVLRNSAYEDIQEAISKLE